MRLVVCCLSLLLTPLAWASSEQVPRRIVSLSPHITELLFSAGLGPRVVATDEASDYPPEVRTLPKVSNYQGVNLEALLALRPDRVVLWPSGTPARDQAAFVRLGLATAESSPETFSQISADVRRFAQWASPEARTQAEITVAAAEKNLQALEKQYALRRTVRVFYQLGEGALFTLSDRHLIGAALKTCGAQNVFGEMKLHAPQVTREAVLLARPDAVLVASEKALPAVRQQWQAFTEFVPNQQPAQRYVAVDGERLHRPTLRTLESLPALCESIERVRASLPAVR